MAEETGLRQVVESYGDMVYRLALAQTHSGHDADDVFQEVFLRYLRSAPDFREEEHRKAWLLRVTVNCCKKFHTSFWRQHTTALSETIPARTEEEGELLQLMEGLPEKYRAVLHLYYYEGYATGEIAAILGRSPNTVRSQLSRERYPDAGEGFRSFTSGHVNVQLAAAPSWVEEPIVAVEIGAIQLVYEHEYLWDGPGGGVVRGQDDVVYGDLN